MARTLNQASLFNTWFASNSAQCDWFLSVAGLTRSAVCFKCHSLERGASYEHHRLDYPTDLWRGGGNIVGRLIKSIDLGPVGNSIAGILGGGLGGQLLG